MSEVKAHYPTDFSVHENECLNGYDHQEECDSLLLRKERLKEEVGQSFSIWFNSTWALGHESRQLQANRMKGKQIKTLLLMT